MIIDSNLLDGLRIGFGCGFLFTLLFVIIVLWVCMKSEDDDSKGGADERDITVSKRTD